MNLSILESTAKSWEGTPYVYGQCKKGEGVDCTRYALMLLQASGALPAGLRIQPQPIKKRYGGRMPALIASLKLEGCKDVANGSLIIFENFCMGQPHLALMTYQGLTHSVVGPGVLFGDDIRQYKNTSFKVFKVLGHYKCGVLQSVKEIGNI